MGREVAARKHKTVVTLTWKYAAGQQSVDGFKEAFEKDGGKVVKELTLPFPNVEFQPFLTEIASLKPDAVFVFFAGAGAVKFVKDYAAAGLRNTIPLYASGFLTDGTLEAMGDAGQGLITTLHYADGILNAQNQSFRLRYAKAYKVQPDVYAVQGFDAAQLLDLGLAAAGGDIAKRAGAGEGDGVRAHREPARQRSRCRRRTTRSRTSICARPRARRTSCSRSRSRRSRIRRGVARCSSCGASAAPTPTLPRHCRGRE